MDLYISIATELKHHAAQLTGEAQHWIVLVQGNYLLLNEEPWCRLRNDVFDETWFLDVPVAECMRRVTRRHVATGKTEETARWRVENNDAVNAQLVATTSIINADRVIRMDG